MKKLYIILILILIFILSGCQKVISAETIVTATAENTINISETTINNDYYNNLKIEYDRLVEEKQKLEEENKAYSYLLNNLNNLLRNVYYGYASNDKYILDGFTAFSIYYNGKYYLLTAGHCVKNEYGKFKNFKFKANFSDTWIYPKLLAYDNDFLDDRDYAIFYSNKISDGFIKYSDNMEGKKFILGSINNNLNAFREYLGKGVHGESGSPVININQEVIAIYNNRFTNIKVVLNKIDELK